MGDRSTHGCWEPPQGVTQTLWGLREHPWVPLGPPWAHRGHSQLWALKGQAAPMGAHPIGNGSTHGCWEPPQGVTQTL